MARRKLSTIEKQDRRMRRAVVKQAAAELDRIGVKKRSSFGDLAGSWLKSATREPDFAEKLRAAKDKLRADTKDKRRFRR